MVQSDPSKALELVYCYLVKLKKKYPYDKDEERDDLEIRNQLVVSGNEEKTKNAFSAYMKFVLILKLGFGCVSYEEFIALLSSPIQQHLRMDDKDQFGRMLDNSFSKAIFEYLKPSEVPPPLDLKGKNFGKEVKKIWSGKSERPLEVYNTEQDLSIFDSWPSIESCPGQSPLLRSILEVLIGKDAISHLSNDQVVIQYKKLNEAVTAYISGDRKELPDIHTLLTQADSSPGSELKRKKKRPIKVTLDLDGKKHEFVIRSYRQLGQKKCRKISDGSRDKPPASIFYWPEQTGNKLPQNVTSSGVKDFEKRYPKSNLKCIQETASMERKEPKKKISPLFFAPNTGIIYKADDGGIYYYPKAKVLLQLDAEEKDIAVATKDQKS